MNKNMSATNAAGVIWAALLLIVVGLLIPLAYIWAWNTLFGSVLFIETTFWTWLAATILTGALTVRRVK
jgi:hypothetical protein